MLRVAVHKAGHAVVGLRLGFDIDYAIIGAGLTRDDGTPMGGEVHRMTAGMRRRRR
jgi:hypothetical protein